MEPPKSLAMIVLGLSGFAALVHEIAWTRILTLVFGPTTYAFAATVAIVIAGIAIGAAVGTWLAGSGVGTVPSKKSEGTVPTHHPARRGTVPIQPAAWLALAFALAALSATWTYSIAGQRIPSLVAHQVAASSNLFADVLKQNALLTAALILPTTICLGAAFPLALAIARGRAGSVAGRFGLVYSVNTLGAVSGSLAAGFLLIPQLGLRSTLILVSICLIAAALIVIARGGLSRRAQVIGLITASAAAASIVFSPAWDRDLLASGVYMYAENAPKDVDLDTLLKAGTLLYYRKARPRRCR